jgi:hypothetical protein
MIHQRGSSKIRFSKEEDQFIQQLVLHYGQKWVKISKVMKTRTAKQIRERYVNYLDPNTHHQKWTDEEDEKLILLISKSTNICWKNLTSHFPGRTDVCLKNRFATLNFKKKMSNFLDTKKSNESDSEETFDSFEENIMEEIVSEFNFLYEIFFPKQSKDN